MSDTDARVTEVMKIYTTDMNMPYTYTSCSHRWILKFNNNVSLNKLPYKRYKLRNIKNAISDFVHVLCLPL